MHNTHQISAVIITCNEAKNIERALKSLDGVADECIVVDSGSTDETLALAKSLGAKIIQQEWLGYGPQKNVGAQAASYDYILSIDADEALNDSLRQSILKIKAQETPMHAAYSFRLLPNYCGHWIYHCGWYPDVKIRLFNKNQARWNDQAVHETLIIAPPCQAILLEGDLLHYSYSCLDDHRRKSENYARLKAKYKYEKNLKSSLLKAYLAACVNFLSIYIVRLGFLDGKAGYQISKFTGITSYKAYKYLYELHKNNPTNAAN